MKKINKKLHRVKENILNNPKRGKNRYKLLEQKDIKDIKNEKVSLPQNQVKRRNPGIDLGRMITMYAIVISHILGSAGLKNKFRHYYILKVIFASTNFHNSTFVFISGYIGYKTTKYSNLIYIWFWVLFYSLGIKFYLIKFKPHTFKAEINYLDFFPIFTNQYWYFTIYFGMYLFLPVINKGLEIITKSQLKITFISFIFFFVILRGYISPNNDIFKESDGGSVLWFLIFFITGAYFGKFNNNENISSIKKFIYCIIYILIFYFASYFAVKSPDYIINYRNQNFRDKIKLFIKLLFVVRNSSIVQILQSISVISFLTSIKYNKFISKVVTFVGPLVFGVYLIHSHPIIFGKIFIPHFKNNYSSNLPLNTVLKILVSKSLQTYIICIIIDYFRNLLFKIFQIRKICILLEKIILKIFG